MSKTARSNSKWSTGQHPFVSAGEGISDFVSFSIKHPCTFADVVREIARKRNLRVEGLPPRWESIDIPTQLLSAWNAAREKDGWVLPVHGSASERVKVLCGWMVDPVEYKIVGRALRFREVETGGGLSRFDELSGRLMTVAPRGSNGRIADEDYRRIVAELDKAGYRPIEHLEGECRKALAVWNSKHSRSLARLTFLSAYNDAQFKTGVRRRLQRAEEKYKKARQIASSG